MSFADKLLDVIQSSSLENLCNLVGDTFNNPVLILDYDFMPLACSKKANIDNFTELGSLEKNAMKKRNMEKKTIDILEFEIDKKKCYCFPVLNGEVHVSSLIVIEENKKISNEDIDLIKTARKGLSIIQAGLNIKEDSTNLVYEYVLVRTIVDETEAEAKGRFLRLGYNLKKNFRIMVLERGALGEIGVDKKQLQTLARMLRNIVGNNGICTTLKDYIVVLLNMDNDDATESIIKEIESFCENNDWIAGVSDSFTDIDDIKIFHRNALDALGTGRLILPNDRVYYYSGMKLYRLAAVMLRSMPKNDLIPASLVKLIEYDRKNNAGLVDTLYYYIYTLKNSKKASEMMHIHRNTFTYRMDKIVDIMGVDLEDGDTFLQIGLAFKVLETLSCREGRKPCFNSIHSNTLLKD